MKITVLLLAISLAPLFALADDLLDIPLRPEPKESLVAALSRVGDSLPEDDRFFFSLAWSAIRGEFVVTEAYSGIPLEQREAAFAEHIAGLTPRKIIIGGMILRAVQLNGLDDWENQISGEERVARRQHMKKEGLEACNMTAIALKRYKKVANQRSEVNKQVEK